MMPELRITSYTARGVIALLLVTTISQNLRDGTPVLIAFYEFERAPLHKVADIKARKKARTKPLSGRLP
ncbi:hypothetical protein CEXT_220231, partial [Caerostris extrusa]